MKKSLVYGTALAFGTLVMNPAAISPAYADIVSTQDIVTEQRAGVNKAQLTEQLERADVQEQLVRYGVDPQEALERINSMTNEEILELTANIDELPAGANAVVVILLVFIIWILIR
ncbi:MAG: PA2779 family protein [Idiomarina sp.]|nr:PA2779 family protein [Idiomarina sp.]